jgi:hypothetical protein
LLFQRVGQGFDDILSTFVYLRFWNGTVLPSGFVEYQGLEVVAGAQRGVGGNRWISRGVRRETGKE